MNSFDAKLGEAWPKVFALAVRITRNRAEAEDVTQETFLTAYRHAEQFRGEADPVTWLCRIAIRLALKARARTAKVTSSEFVEPTATTGGEAAAVARLDAARVERAMSTLSFEQRTALALFAVEGLKHQQIAEVLGVAEGTVWSRLHAARQSLKAALAESP